MTESAPPTMLFASFGPGSPRQKSQSLLSYNNYYDTEDQTITQFLTQVTNLTALNLTNNRGVTIDVQ